MIPRSLLPASALVLCLAALTACSRRETPAERGIRTQTLLVGNYAEPADLDPQSMNAFTDSQIAYTLFEGLTTLDAKSSRAVPAAADHWSVSPDGTVYVFHIRAGARWSNGEPVTAEDFVYSFRRILDPAFAAVYSYMLWPIKNAEAFNAGTLTDFSKVGVRARAPDSLEVTLTQPTPYLPELAAHTTWLPVHKPVIEKFGPMNKKGTDWTRPGNLVGNGAFTLAEWVPNARISVSKNPLYWDAAATRLNEVQFYPIEKETVEELAYRSGQLHATNRLPSSKIDVYRRHVPTDLRSDPILSTGYLILNVTRPPMDNKKLRQALARAMDRLAIARDVTQGAYTPAHSLTPPGCGGYTAAAGIPDDYAEARRLLAEAGYPGGKGLGPIEVQSYTADVSLRMMEAVQAMWHRELGVDITISQIEQKTLFQNGQSGNYVMGTSAWIADYADPSTFLGTMVTGCGNNWPRWSNAEYDRLIDEASRSPDRGRRFALFQRAEAILLDEAPLIPIYYETQTYAISPAVRGWTTNLMGFHAFNRIWLEK